MAKVNTELLAFNRGVISKKVMARVDVPRIALSAEIQTNYIPDTLGPMSLRPGLKYLTSTKSNQVAKNIPFVYSITDKAIIELTNNLARIIVNGSLLTRATVSATIANSGFDTDLSSWTDLDEGSAASTWLTGGYLSLLGTGTSAAIREQLVTVGAYSGTQHAIRVTVERGPVTIRIGSSSGGEQYLEQTELKTGVHSLTFTPTGNFYVQLLSRSEYPCLVNACAIESASTVEIPTIWPTAALPNIRYAQSGDVIFVTCYGYRQQRIERRPNSSWSIVDYTADKGPFRVENLTDTTIAASALTGLVTLTASTPIFKSGHVGGLFKLISNGQSVTQDASAQNTFTNSIKVEGTAKDRIFGVNVSGTWVGTVTLQRSVGVEGNWTDVTSYTTNQSTSLDDSLSNQVIYYRLGIKTGGYTSGMATMTLIYANGSITGIARVSAYSSSTSVTAFVLQDFGSTSATTKWAEGLWSSYRGFPSSVALRDSRVWMAGKDRICASVVDDFENHDPSYIGDAGPINRSIGEGPVDNIGWLVSANQLVAGGAMNEHVVRSSLQDEPITPINFNLRPGTSHGSYGIDAEVLDEGILFIDRSGVQLISATFNAQGMQADDLTGLSPEMLEPSIVDLAVQRRPDTRIHCVRSDGKVALLVYSKMEEVKAWITIETDGVIEEAIVLPGNIEDEVYYVVRRTINGNTVRFLEQWALASECVGGNANKQADAFVYYSGAAITNVTGLSHLEGETVVCWADGADKGTFVVSGGGITLSVAASNIVVGLGYTAQFKSTKLAVSGLSLINKKRVNHLGLLLMDTHYQGIQYGSDFTNLNDMPLIEAGAPVATDTIWEDYNYDHFELDGTYTVDSRLCLQSAAPRPCTVLAAVIELDI